MTVPAPAWSSPRGGLTVSRAVAERLANPWALDETPADVERMFRVNVVAPRRLAQLAPLRFSAASMNTAHRGR
jgi:NAD(P)-dependent dehydrogenase (short-subunit alcohol dehydrogenase family)